MADGRPPFSLVGLDHIVYYVDDLDRAVRFYTDVLGCQPGYSYPRLGMEQLWCGDALIVLSDIRMGTPGKRPEALPAPFAGNIDHLCINLSPFDRDALRAHLVAHGVTIETEAFHGGARGMGHSFYIRDPFGNLLELKGPPVYPDGR